MMLCQFFYHKKTDEMSFLHFSIYEYDKGCTIMETVEPQLVHLASTWRLARALQRHLLPPDLLMFCHSSMWQARSNIFFRLLMSNSSNHSRTAFEFLKVQIFGSCEKFTQSSTLFFYSHSWGWSKVYSFFCFKLNVWHVICWHITQRRNATKGLHIFT